MRYVSVLFLSSTSALAIYFVFIVFHLTLSVRRRRLTSSHVANWKRLAGRGAIALVTRRLCRTKTDTGINVKGVSSVASSMTECWIMATVVRIITVEYQNDPSGATSSSSFFQNVRWNSTLITQNRFQKAYYLACEQTALKRCDIAYQGYNKTNLPYRWLQQRSSKWTVKIKYRRRLLVCLRARPTKTSQPAKIDAKDVKHCF